MTILQGLKIIDKAGLPHPEWEFVRSSKDLKKFPQIQDYVGWTIRTVDIKNGPWKNLYINWLPKRKVPGKIDEFQKKQKNKALFVVYPSWKWKKGGTILIEKDRVVVEAVKGQVEDLMRRGQVDASYFYPVRNPSRLINHCSSVSKANQRRNPRDIISNGVYQKGKLVNTTGDKNLLTVSERRKILQAPKKIKMKNVILEWGITTQNKFIFYRIEKVKEAARLLLKKYL